MTIKLVHMNGQTLQLIEEDNVSEILTLLKINLQHIKYVFFGIFKDFFIRFGISMLITGVKLDHLHVYYIEFYIVLHA